TLGPRPGPRKIPTCHERFVKTESLIHPALPGSPDVHPRYLDSEHRDPLDTARTRPAERLATLDRDGLRAHVRRLPARRWPARRPAGPAPAVPARTWLVHGCVRRWGDGAERAAARPGPGRPGDRRSHRHPDGH